MFIIFNLLCLVPPVEICAAIAASVEDARIMYPAHVPTFGQSQFSRRYSTIAAPPYRLPQPAALFFPSYGDRDLSGIRVGLMPSYNSFATAEVQDSTHSIQEVLMRQGATIVNITIPHLSAAFKAHVVSILTEMRTAMYDLLLT